jgi:SAM-dependent methyltransferase
VTSCRVLRSIDYEPTDEPSLFWRWEHNETAAMTAPIAVRSAAYRELLADMLEPHLHPGATLLSVGAGNGFAEVELQRRGWDVTATDRADDALAHCRAKGLRTTRLDLLADPPIGRFDAVYSDGVLGHLWQEGSATSNAWLALAALAAPGAVCLASNDLADDDHARTLRVRSAATAEFYRPPAGWFAHEAIATGRWALDTERVRLYERGGERRRRELVLMRLLMDDRVVAEDRKEPRDRDRARVREVS